MAGQDRRLSASNTHVSSGGQQSGHDLTGGVFVDHRDDQRARGECGPRDGDLLARGAGDQDQLVRAEVVQVFRLPHGPAGGQVLLEGRDPALMTEHRHDRERSGQTFLVDRQVRRGSGEDAVSGLAVQLDEHGVHPPSGNLLYPSHWSRGLNHRCVLAVHFMQDHHYAESRTTTRTRSSTGSAGAACPATAATTVAARCAAIAAWSVVTVVSAGVASRAAGMSSTPITARQRGVGSPTAPGRADRPASPRTVLAAKGAGESGAADAGEEAADNRRAAEPRAGDADKPRAAEPREGDAEKPGTTG